MGGKSLAWREMSLVVQESPSLGGSDLYKNQMTEPGWSRGMEGQDAGVGEEREALCL